MTETASCRIHGYSGRTHIVCGSIREQHRVRLGVRKVEATAKCVTQLVMKSHLHRSECGAREPRAVHRVGPGGQVSW